MTCGTIFISEWEIIWEKTEEKVLITSTEQVKRVKYQT